MGNQQGKKAIKSSKSEALDVRLVFVGRTATGKTTFLRGFFDKKKKDEGFQDLPSVYEEFRCDVDIGDNSVNLTIVELGEYYFCENDRLRNFYRNLLDYDRDPNTFILHFYRKPHNALFNDIGNPDSYAYACKRKRVRVQTYHSDKVNPAPTSALTLDVKSCTQKNCVKWFNQHLAPAVQHLMTQTRGLDNVGDGVSYTSLHESYNRYLQALGLGAALNKVDAMFASLQAAQPNICAVNHSLMVSLGIPVGMQNFIMQECDLMGKTSKKAVGVTLSSREGGGGLSIIVKGFQQRTDKEKENLERSEKGETVGEPPKTFPNSPSSAESSCDYYEE